MPERLQVHYCSSSKSLETCALMASIQAWVIRIWSRVIRTSDQAPGFFYRYAKWLDFLTEASLTRFLISFSKTTQFFFSPSSNFLKIGNQNFFFNLESISGQPTTFRNKPKIKIIIEKFFGGPKTENLAEFFFGGSTAISENDGNIGSSSRNYFCFLGIGIGGASTFAPE